MPEQKYGFTEIVDTLTDLVNAANKFSESVKGRFDIMRFLSFALDTYPKVQEAIQDWDVFVSELKELTPQEALDAVAQIELNTPKTPVSSKMVDTLKLLALTYDYVNKTWVGGDLLLRFGKGIFS